MKIVDLEILDLRFPTARAAIGTDAMHPDPDYSAAYVILKTDSGREGHGLTFTIGRGNEICAAAIEAFRHHVVGRTLADLTNDLGAFWREHLAVGHPDRDRLATHPERLRLALDHLTDRPRKTHWPWESPHHPATRDHSNMP